MGPHVPDEHWEDPPLAARPNHFLLRASGLALLIPLIAIGTEVLRARVAPPLVQPRLAREAVHPLLVLTARLGAEAGGLAGSALLDALRDRLLRSGLLLLRSGLVLVQTQAQASTRGGHPSGMERGVILLGLDYYLRQIGPSPPDISRC